MNDIARRMFPHKAYLYDHGLCTNCENGINFSTFRTDIDRKEYKLSGMCQECQDAYFTNNN